MNLYECIILLSFFDNSLPNIRDKIYIVVFRTEVEISQSKN